VLLGGGGLGGIEVDGDAGVLARLMALVERPNPLFAIVTP
jgi:hypothetical protein